MNTLKYFTATILTGAALSVSATAKKPSVLIKTSKGDITVELNAEMAPVSVVNFLKYVEKKHYDRTVFHRVIEDFMIQGGGFAKGDPPAQKEGMAPIKNEADNGLKNDRGTIAMARTRAPHSATAQFFINVKDNDGLNPGGFDPFGYAVFGKVTDGMDVVDAVRKVKTGEQELVTLGGKHSMSDVPVEQVVIESISVIREAGAKPEAGAEDAKPEAEKVDAKPEAGKSGITLPAPKTRSSSE